MRLQISLEFLLYLSMAGVAMLFAASCAARLAPRLYGYMGSYQVSSFVQQLDYAALSGAGSAELYLPRGVCNSSIDGESMRTVYGNFALEYEVEAGDALCPDGMEANISIEQEGQVVRLGRN